MKERIKELYQKVILQHSKFPFQYEERLDATHQLEAYNPMCGDKYRLFLEVEKGKITDISFHGYGCAISKAATSVLAKHLQDQPLEKAHEICENYLSYLENDSERKEVTIEDFEAFSAVQSFPERLTCANLSWKEVQLFLQKK